jgi:hypothetical protein
MALYPDECDGALVCTAVTREDPPASCTGGFEEFCETEFVASGGLHCPEGDGCTLTAAGPMAEVHICMQDTGMGPSAEPYDPGTGMGPSAEPHHDPGTGMGPSAEPHHDPGTGMGPSAEPYDPGTGMGPSAEPHHDAGTGMGPSAEPDMGPSAEPSPDDRPPAAIIATLTLDVTMAMIEADQDFETNFKTDVASALNVQPEQIDILGYKAGSVEVDFKVYPDSAGVLVELDAVLSAFPAGTTVAGAATTMAVAAEYDEWVPTTCIFVDVVVDGAIDYAADSADMVQAHVCKDQIGEAAIEVKSTCSDSEVCRFSALINCVTSPNGDCDGMLATCQAVANTMRAMSCGGEDTGTGMGPSAEPHHDPGTGMGPATEPTAEPAAGR